MMKVKIYCDSGADIKCLKEFYPICVFYQYPYDSSYRNKRLIKQGIMKLAEPSEAQWRDCHQTWEESNFTWDEAIGSHNYANLIGIIKQGSKKSAEELRRDVLHLDSAYKTGCYIFITSDKDIISRRLEIENLCGIKIFQSHKELTELKACLKTMISKKD